MYSFFRSPVAWVLVVVVALACGTGYWVVDQRWERERVEREQAESDRQEQQRFAASETRRKRDQQLMQDELKAKRDDDEKQRQLAIEFSQAELNRGKFVADDGSVPQDERAQRERENKAQTEAARELLRSQNEVIRQKNYLIQRENEREKERYQREVDAERARQAQQGN